MHKLDKRFIERIRHSVGSTIESYQLIQENDHILIGVSGGKDSLALLDILAARQRYSPVSYKLTACHVMVKNIGYEINRRYLEDFCRQRSVDFLFHEVEYSTMPGKEDQTKCFFCSWTRRKTLFDLSKELHCNKIATGHHLDDAVQTLLMNLTFHASVSSLPASLRMFDGRINFIRPLIEQFDDEMKRYVQIMEYPQLKTACPYNDDSKRHAMKHILDQLQALNRDAKLSMFRAMSNINSEYLPQKARSEA